MGKSINIINILKDKPKGTKLYSPICGDCELHYIDLPFTINVKVRANISYGDSAVHYIEFDSEGKYGNDFKDNTVERECLLFPSKEMQDWSKFAWKKGDVLTNKCGFMCIFKEWATNDYTKFNGSYTNSRDGYEDVSDAETIKFNQVDDNTSNKYICKIEKELGGTLNLSTLEIEKPKPQFKDGDIVFVTDNHSYNAICIYKEISGNMLSYHAKIDADTLYLKPQNDFLTIEDRIVRIATEEDKQQLFDVLAKEGKAWDAEKKLIVDLPKKPQFKDGDIICLGGEYNHILIFKRSKDSVFYYYAMRTIDNKIIVDYNIVNCNDNVRIATDEEKRLLFAALSKENKAWDAEKKQIIDLPKKCEFKPFDKVLVRDNNDNKWQPAFFIALSEDRCKDGYPYEVISKDDTNWKQCIPYNEQTAHLLGTTIEWKGGEE